MCELLFVIMWFTGKEFAAGQERRPENHRSQDGNGEDSLRPQQLFKVPVKKGMVLMPLFRSRKCVDVERGIEGLSKNTTAFLVCQIDLCGYFILQIKFSKKSITYSLKSTKQVK